jgi:hypothetical protein
MQSFGALKGGILDEYHPDRNALERFVRGEAPADAERWIVDHIRSGCASCQRTVDDLLPRLETRLPPAEPTDLDAWPRAAGTRPPLLYRFLDSSGPPAEDPSASPAPGAHEGRPMGLTSVLPLVPPGPAGSPAWLPQGRLGPMGPSRATPAVSGSAAEAQAGAGNQAWPAAWESRPAGSLRRPDLGDDCDGDGCGAGLPEILGEAPEVGNEALDRILVKLLEHRLPLIVEQRCQAPRLLGELLQRPAAERSALLHASRRFHTLALCKLLCDKSLEAGYRDSAEAVALAELGLLVADHLDAGFYTATVVHDMRAGAWACLGNARRLGADFAGAEQALAFAESLAEEGTADPLEEARLLDLKASLLSDQGWFEEAVELLDLVIEIYEEVKELHLKGKALISKGVNFGYAGWPQRAVELIRLGLAQLDAGSEPRLELEAVQDLAWFLNDCGHCDQAQVQLDRCRPGLEAAADSWTRLRTEWLDTRIALRSGRWQEAEHRLGRQVLQLVQRGLGYEAALVMLDLAAFYLEHGRLSEIRRLADDMLPIFCAQGIHRQAVGALVAFQQAAVEDQLTPALVREIGSYLLRARKNPDLDFKRAA